MFGQRWDKAVRQPGAGEGGCTMKNSTGQFRHLLAFVVLTALVTLALPQPGAAQAPRPGQVTVIFILDDSGSMAENDPTDLRYTAAKLFVAALDEGDVVAAIRFSTTSQTMTQQLVPIASPLVKTQLIAALQPVKAEGYTDVKAAFTDAERLLKGAATATQKTVVVFLTDGAPYPPQPYPGYEDDALSIATRLGAPVYAIALTRQGESAFLTNVAGQTGGKVIPTKSANDLLDTYLQILGDLKDRTLIGAGAVSSPTQTTLLLDPALTPYVSKVTWIVSHESSVRVQVVGPDGKEVKATDPMVTFAVTADAGFTVYTVADPAGGGWRFNLSGSGSAEVRGILHSRLRVRVISLPGMVEAGVPLPIVVNLIEEQADGSIVKIVGDATFSAIVTPPGGPGQSLDAFYDDGTHGDVVAGDGNFTREFMETAEQGTYAIAVSGRKGVIPVTTATKVEAVVLPRLVIDQPANPSYDIRTNTVPLRIHLEGAEASAALEGGFSARVTSPAGQVYYVALRAQQAVFSGEFAPVESGQYKVEFQPEKAYYRGVPFQKQASTAFEAVMVGRLTIRSVKLGLGGAASQERFEVQEAVQGIPVLVTIGSSATAAEQVVPRLENLPGFALAEVGPIAVAPNGETMATLHLVGDRQLQPGKWDGGLVFAPQGPVDIANDRAQIKFELYTPQITFSAQTVSACVAKKCWQWAPVWLILKTSSTSSITEKVDIQLEGIAGATLSYRSVEVKPGDGQVELQINPATGFTPGQYKGLVTFGNARPGVVVLPRQPLNIAYQVDPWWTSCRRPLIGVGVCLLILVLVVGTVIGGIARKNRPPLVTGTLVYWSKDAPDVTSDKDLTAMRTREVRIGTAAGNEVPVADEAMAELHAVIVAERLEDKVRLTLQPRAKVRKGYKEYAEPLPLEENVTYQIGNHMFKYIPDAAL